MYNTIVPVMCPADKSNCLLFLKDATLIFELNNLRQQNSTHSRPVVQLITVSYPYSWCGTQIGPFVV